MRDKIRNFMIGRYGPDGLNQFLTGAALACMVLSIFFHGPLPRLLMYGLLGWSLFRMFSRNIAKRSQENAVFYALKQKFMGDVHRKQSEWKQRDQYKFFRCPKCGQKLRVPRGHGPIEITCPKCSTQFVKKS